MSKNAPKIVAIAGPNGAGKSTFETRLLPDRYGAIVFLNADTIAHNLSPSYPQDAAFEAGRIMLKQMRGLIDRRLSFAFETTLASRSFTSYIRRARLLGYEFHLFFLRLASVELAVARVEQRAGMHGHRIAEADIRRRYVRGICNFFQLYQPLADRWYVLDNSDHHPLKIAVGNGSLWLHVFQQAQWQRFYEAQNEC